MRDTGTHTRISIKFSGNGESYLLDCRIGGAKRVTVKFHI